ncbi:DUF3772 domain-containing protein [Azospirillum sp. SYSU D00513]|uniref:DUF3772 domain-containing protein n=1 Tax=Azospirillum sp. SYSU D00513 TaxID=2812561 RepID=UPI001FFF535C|nr:DUF3772 domain-containing protein [Azospirillum sp. SYSU D00513]
MLTSSALRRRIGSALLAGLLLADVSAPLPVLAQNAAPAQAQAEAQDFKAQLAKWQGILNRSASRIADGELGNEEYEALRGELAAVQAEARNVVGAAAVARETSQRMLDSVGPAPAEGQPAEAAPVAAERKRLQQALSEVEGRTKQAELVATRVDILLRTAADQRMSQLTEQIVKRGPMPLSPDSWAELPEQVALVHDRMDRAFSVVLAGDAWQGRLYGLGALAAFLFLVAWPVRRVLLRRYGHRSTEERPSYRQRVGAMAVEAFARCLMPVVPNVVFTVSLLGLLKGATDVGPLSALVLSVSGGLTSFFLVTGVARATLAPEYPAWQLAELDPGSARRLVRRIGVAALGLALAGAGIGLSEAMFTPPELRSVTGFGTMLLIAASLLVLLPGSLWVVAQETKADDCGCPTDATDAAELAPAAPAAPRRAWPRLRFLVGAVAVAAVVASAAGYLALAVYASKLMLTAIIIGGVLLVARGILRELLCLLLERREGRIAEVGDIIAGGDKGRRLLGHAGRLSIDGLLLVAAAFVLLPLTGMTLSEMRGMADSFLGGITVGGVRIAPGDILSAFAMLGVLITITRFVQRQLDERVLAQLSIDDGVRNSIRTGIGYLGTTAAVLVSVGTLGLDLSSLAMIASALSVGIGFGLQNVVSNFISGLIMLVERPIKVGDWVVVNGMEGTVRRISVRATEIQTFQRASVIIPNSEFISKAVVNWTLKDKTTRIEIKVGVSYDCNVRQVYNLLLEIARGHHLVLSHPEPVVMFREFGPSALEFELRIFVSNTDFILPVRNELRMRIVEEFRKRDIQIPFNQQVVHMPKVEALLEQVAASSVVAGAIASTMAAGATGAVAVAEAANAGAGRPAALDPVS